MSDTTSQQKLSWNQVVRLLTNSSKRRLRLRLVDTIFLQSHSLSLPNEQSQVQITDWFFTSKKGDVTKRKASENNTLQHALDRFSRLALTGQNAAGPRIISVVYFTEDGDWKRKRVHLTAEQMEREAKKRSGNKLQGCKFLQCYHRPCEGSDHFFRGEYSIKIVSGVQGREDERITEVSACIVDDFVMASNNARQLGENDSALLKWVQKEIEVILIKVVKNLEQAVDTLQNSNDVSDDVQKCEIIHLFADFILDDNRQIWLELIHGVNLIGCCANLDLGGAVNLSEDKIKSSTIETSVAAISKTKRSQKKKSQRGTNEAMETNYTNGLKHTLRYSETGPGNGEPSNEKPSTEDFISSEANCDEKTHCNAMEERIINLKGELASKNQAKAEHQSKMNTLRSNASTLMRKSCNESQSESDFEKKKNKALHHEISNGKQYVVRQTADIRKEYQSLMINRSSIFNVNNDLIKTEKELKEARDENKNLQNAIDERGKYDELISKLERERTQLAKCLEDSLFSNQEACREYEIRVKDALEAETRANDEVEVYKMEIKAERDSNNQVLGQLKSTNTVLEAELKSQREYVDELRASTLTELAVKIKAGIEAVASQELAKSSIGAAQSIRTCEERWKRRIEEINQENSKVISALQEEHQNEIRYNSSQYRIQLEQTRTEVESRLQKKHSDSIRAALEHKEAQRQDDVRNELKRCEQMVSEMKARLHVDYQKKNHSISVERDKYWKSKMEQQALEANEKVEHEKDIARNELQAALLKFKEDLQLTIENAEDAKKTAINDAIAAAEEKSIQLVEQKERDVLHSSKIEMEDSISRMNDETAAQVAAAVKLGEENAKALQRTIDELHIRHDDEKNKLQNKVKVREKELEHILNQRTEQIKADLSQQNNEEIEKAKIDLEMKVDEMASKHELKLAEVRKEANATISAYMEKSKIENEKVTEEALQEMILDHEEQIQSMEYEVGWIKNQKEAAETALNDMTEKVAEREEIIVELRAEIDSQRVQHSFYKMFMASKAFTLKKELDEKEQQLIENMQQKEERHVQSEKRLRQRLKAMENRASKFEGRIKLISSTLLNHKKEDLMEHKLKSREVAAKLAEINEKIEISDSKREKVQTFLENLEQAMFDVEKQLQDHSQTSALQGGRINISHARKKRRLDEEYEQILSKIELKRDEANNADVDANRLQNQKTVLNNEMRGLEKSLVGILVEQQKTLLSISSRDTGDDS